MDIRTEIGVTARWLLMEISQAETLELNHILYYADEQQDKQCGYYDLIRKSMSSP